MKTGGRSWGAGSNLQKILDTTEIPLKRNYILFDLDIAVLHTILPHTYYVTI